METKARLRRAILGALLAGGVWIAWAGAPRTGFAQKPPATTGVAATAEQDITTIDQQRGALERFLDAHPEIQGEVAGNPSVISSQNYQREHPELEAFLQGHPLVKADPRAFLSRSDWRYLNRRSEFDNLLSTIAPFTVFVCLLLATLWAIRVLSENRRWNRSFKMHEDLHAKLIEKFASGQDFSAYLQSEAGRRLLEWTPPVPDSSHGVSSAVNRILWSLQAGVVLLVVGLGLLVLRGHMDVTDAPPLLVFGTLGVTLGAGFIFSALISYGLSKHLGLIDGHATGSELAMKR